MEHLRWYGFLYILAIVFALSWVGQFVSMVMEKGPFSWATFWAATFENWQSEFLQLGIQALGMVVLAHLIFKKSTEEMDRVEKKLDLLLTVDNILRGDGKHRAKE